MKTPCSEALSELPLFVGGDLEAQAQERVERHLEHCSSCREALGRAQAARDVLRRHLSDPSIELHRPELWGGIRANLLESGKLRPAAGAATAEPASREDAPPRGRLLRLVPVAAAAAGLFFLGTLAGRGGAPGGEVEVAPPAGAVDGALVLEQAPTTIGQPDPQTPGLVPLGDDRPSLRQEAWPWLGDVLPLTSPRPLGASAAGFSSAASYRSDGVR
jgi:hypothetical protein